MVLLGWLLKVLFTLGVFDLEALKLDLDVAQLISVDLSVQFQFKLAFDRSFGPIEDLDCDLVA